MFNINEIEAFRLKPRNKTRGEAKRPHYMVKWQERQNTNLSDYLETNLPFAFKPSEDMIVLDFDTPEACQAISKYIKTTGLKTFMYKTQKGIHMWFRHSEFSQRLSQANLVKNCSKFVTGSGIECDVRLGGKGYVAIRLAWDTGNVEDRTHSFTHTDSLAEIPDELIPVLDNARDKVDLVAYLGTGSRNDKLTRFIGIMKSWYSKIKDKSIIDWDNYAEKCLHALDNYIYVYEGQLDDYKAKLKTFKDVNSTPSTFISDYDVANDNKYVTITSFKDTKHGSKPDTGIYNYQGYEIPVRKSGHKWKIKSSIETAELIQAKLNWQVWNGISLYNHNGIIKRAERGINEVESVIYRILCKLDIEKYDNQQVTYVLKNLIENNQWETNRDIHFLNGVYNWDTKQFKPRNSDIISPYTIPHNYDKDAKAPELWHTLLNNVSGGNEDIINQIKESFAVSLLDSVEIKKFFIIQGPTNTGKSVMYDKILRSIIGKDNISSESLQFLTSKNAGSTLVGKLINFVDDDSPNIGVKMVDKLKSLSDGNTIQIEAKYQQPFTASPCATLIFNMNQVPDFVDPSGAMDTRLQVIPFHQEFNDASAQHKADIRDKVKKMINSEADIQGIINDVLLTLSVLHDNHFKLTKSALTKEIHMEQVSINQRELGWLRENFEFDVLDTMTEMYKEREYISTAELFSAFNMYCERSNIPKTSMNGFRRNLAVALNNFNPEGVIIDRLPNAVSMEEYQWIQDYVTKKWEHRAVNDGKRRMRGYRITLI